MGEEFVPLATRKALCPLGIRWRVLRLDPYPIYESQIRQSLFTPNFSWPNSTSRRRVLPGIRAVGIRTLGIAACPLKRLRTRLSIPLGLRHEGSTPVQCQILALVIRLSRYLTHKAVRLVAVEALRIYRGRQSRIRDYGGRCGVRFLTIATCFLAATIYTMSALQRHFEAVDVL